MKSKLLITLTTLFCLFASLQASAQVPPPTGDGDGDGDDIIFYFACINSDGEAVFTRYPNLTPAQRAAYCDDEEEGGGGLIPTGN